jgi:hypothetical protein
MAVVYPLNLDALKREIDAAENLNLNLDTTGLTIEERLVRYKTLLQNVQDTYNNGIEGRKTEFNTMLDKVVEIGNDLKGKIGLLEGFDSDTLQDIANIKELVEGAGLGSLISVADKTADELNSRYAVKPFTAIVNDATGKATVDISALNIVATTDYTAVISANATANFVFTHSAAKKVDANTVEVIAYDAKHTVEEAELYDGTTTPASFVVYIGYYPPKLSTVVTKTDDTTVTVGNEEA